MKLPVLRALSPELSHSLLQLRLESVLQFAINNVTRLDRAAKIWAEPTDPYVEAVDKVIVETALFALLVSRVARPSVPVQSLLCQLLGELAELARTDRNKVYLMRYPQTAASLGITQIILLSLGRPDPEFDNLIESAFTAGHVDAVERLPYRRADVRWLKGLVQPRTTLSFDDIIPDLIISTRAHPIYMSAADTYALTHDLMYISDFGSRPVPSGVDVGYISETVDAALAWHLGTGNLDLLAELLLAAALLRGPWSPYAQFAWSFLNTTWNEFGFLPSPTFDTKAFGALPDDDASAYVFKNVYHTTYVAGILAAILLNYPESDQESEATWGLPVPRKRPGLLECCERVLARAAAFCSSRSGQSLDPGGSSSRQASTTPATQCGTDRTASQDHPGVPQTLYDLLRLTKARNAPELARALESVPLSDDMKGLVLVDTLLITAAREYDLASLASLLIYASECGIPPSLTVNETVDFLTRQSLQSGVIGAHFTVAENLAYPVASEVTAGLALAIATAATRLAAEPACTSAGRTGMWSEFAPSTRYDEATERTVLIPPGRMAANSPHEGV